MRYDYPYTDFHEINLDYILKMARESLGLKLVVEGNKLLLKNDLDETISNVTVSYADTALKDVSNKPIQTYLLSVSTNSDDKLVFTKGDGTTTVIAVPKAKKADTDKNGTPLTSYLNNVEIEGNSLKFSNGAGQSMLVNVPFATKAQGDKNGKDITTYIANITTSGDELILTDGAGTILKSFKVSYAEEAKNDVDGDPIKSYAKNLQTGERTVKLLDKNGAILGEITVPFATMAMEDTSGHSLLEDYGVTLDAVNNDVVLKSFSGKTLSTITVPFATLSTDATNAIERVEISGNTIAFTTYGGTRYDITAPYALKATDDGSGNTITKNYVAAVEKDSTTGDFVFKAKDGTEIARLVSTSETAKNDTYGNLIANYVKSIIAEADSNYITITHGDGTVDSLTVNYAQKAWKDSYGNIIGNMYVAFLKTINDEETGEPLLVAYNGEKAEIFRIAITAVSAQKDDKGNNIFTSYASNLTFSDNALKLLSKSGAELASVPLEIPEPITGYGKSLDIANKTLTLKDENSNDLSSVNLPIPEIPEPITGYGKSLDIANKTLTLKDESGVDLSSVELPIPEPPTPYVLPTASESILGGIKVGDNLSIASDGTLSAPTPTEPYTLPVASSDILGGIKVGNSLSIDNEVLNEGDYSIFGNGILNTLYYEHYVDRADVRIYNYNKKTISGPLIYKGSGASVIYNNDSMAKLYYYPELTVYRPINISIEGTTLSGLKARETIYYTPIELPVVSTIADFAYYASIDTSMVPDMTSNNSFISKGNSRFKSLELSISTTNDSERILDQVTFSLEATPNGNINNRNKGHYIIKITNTSDTDLPTLSNTISVDLVIRYNFAPTNNAYSSAMYGSNDVSAKILGHKITSNTAQVWAEKGNHTFIWQYLDGLEIYDSEYNLIYKRASKTLNWVNATATTTQTSNNSSKITLNSTDATTNSPVILRCLVDNIYPVGCFIWPATKYSPI